ncbi:MAG: GGDEF domain-containing protein [Frankiaceae bacterium]|nr:GGDEF domain-containing protein [Arenimonas sp.]
MAFLLRPGHARPALFGLAALLLLLVASLALALSNPLVLAGALACGGILIATVYQLLAQAEQRARASEQSAESARAEVHRIQASQESRSTDLALLGRYGNLLIGCTDLAEALQISEQMLSLLLPDSAGTIYPLIDGEGLAEATHLWGIHAANTQLHASAEDCWCMQRKRMHLGNSTAPESLCTHVALGEKAETFCAACIPLIAQGESLGWIYLTAHGTGAFPKLQVAVAAADQLALALANLKLRQSLRDLSVRDPLTGLFNRRYLSESLGREMSRSKRRGLPLAVLAFDLDRFKDFNDRFGHAAGDAVLVAFARILQSNSRSEDIACRQGGEEFVLIAPEMDIGVGLRRAGELMGALAGMDVLHEGQLLPKLTTSIGVAIFPEHGQSPEGLLAQADQALYQAKAHGRNRVIVALPPSIELA